MTDMAIRYTIKDLLLATTLIGIGTGGVVMASRQTVTNVLELWTWIATMMIAGAALGAGIVAPLKQPVLGAGIGAFIAAITLSTLLFVFNISHVN